MTPNKQLPVSKLFGNRVWNNDDAHERERYTLLWPSKTATEHECPGGPVSPTDDDQAYQCNAEFRNPQNIWMFSRATRTAGGPNRRPRTRTPTYMPVSTKDFGWYSGGKKIFSFRRFFFFTLEETGRVAATSESRIILITISPYIYK